MRKLTRWIRTNSNSTGQGVGTTELSIISVKNVPFTVTAEVTLPDDSAGGVIFAQGGRLSGWSLYMLDGRIAYEHNFLGVERYKMASAHGIGPGTHTVELRFVPDEAARLGSGGVATLRVDDSEVAEMQTPRMVYGAFSFDDGADVGTYEGTPVSLDYLERDNAFTGAIDHVTIATQ